MAVLRVISAAVTTVTAVIAMHEDVEQRAQQEQRERQHTERVRAMFRQQEERGDREKPEQRDIESSVASWSIGYVVRVIHGGAPVQGRVRNDAHNDASVTVNGA